MDLVGFDSHECTGLILKFLLNPHITVASNSGELRRFYYVLAENAFDLREVPLKTLLSDLLGSKGVVCSWSIEPVRSGRAKGNAALEEAVGVSFSPRAARVRLPARLWRTAKELFLLNCFPEQLPTPEHPSAFTFCLNIPLVIENSHLVSDKKGN